MTKQRWLIIRDLEEIPMDVWYSYYLESGGLVRDINEFAKYFAILLLQPMVLEGGKIISISLSSATHRLHRYYNHKFDL